MPVRKLTVSFDLDGEVFARMLANCHSDMHIQVYGDPQKAVDTPLQLEGKATLNTAVLHALKANERMCLRDIREAIVLVGFSAKSLNSALYKLKTERMIRSPKYGWYTLTAKGLANVT
jgi:hypothetical protein